MQGVRVSVEARRGCGFRKGGGLYLVCPPVGEPCSALPVELSVCPTCHAGIKATRGWTWVDPRALLTLPRGPHAPEEHYERCPLAQLDGLGLGERAGLLWVGETFYKSPMEFTLEASRMGVSRRIPAVPNEFKLGTWVLLAHRLAIVDGFEPVNVPREEKAGDIPKGRPGVFHLFRPSAIEYVVRGDETDDELAALRKRGIEPVKVVPEGEQTDLVDQVAAAEAPPRCTLLRDGKEVMTGTEIECWRYIHRHHPFSVDHALKHEGYSIRPEAA